MRILRALDNRIRRLREPGWEPSQAHSRTYNLNLSAIKPLVSYYNLFMFERDLSENLELFSTVVHLLAISQMKLFRHMNYKLEELHFFFKCQRAHALARDTERERGRKKAPPDGTRLYSFPSPFLRPLRISSMYAYVPDVSFKPLGVRF